MKRMLTAPDISLLEKASALESRSTALLSLSKMARIYAGHWFAVFSHLNSSYFEDLPVELKNKLFVQTSLSVNYIHVQGDPSLELEIFLRYNKGTNPMSKQEIRHVLFCSPFNDWVINQVDILKEDEDMAETFNMVKKRFANKTVHADLFLLMSILHFGLNEKHVGTPYYVDEIMSKARKMDNDEVILFIEKSEYIFEQMIAFLRFLKDAGIKHPFSKEIYAPEKKRHHFQSSILMILAAVFKYILEEGIDYKNAGASHILGSLKEGVECSVFYNAKSATTNFDVVSSAVNSIKAKIALL